MYRKIWSLFNKVEKNKVIILLIWMFVLGIIDIIGVGSIMPFLAVIGDPSIIEKNEYLFYIYNYFNFESRNSFLMFLGFLAMTILILSTIFKIITNYRIFRFSNMTRHNIGKKLLFKYISQPYKFFLNKNSSAITKTILSETDLVIGQVIMPALQLIIYTIMTTFMIIFLIYVDPILAFSLMFLFGGFYILMYLTVRQYLEKIGDERNKSNALRFKLISEIIGGIKDLKLLGRENIYINSYDKPSYTYSLNTSTQQIITGIPQYIVEVLSFGAIITMVMYSLINSGSNLGELLPILGLYALAALKLKPSLNSIYSLLGTMKFGNSALNIILKEFEEFKDSENFITNHNKIFRLKNKLEFKNVFFKYDNTNKDTLSNININIKVNTSIGIIGKTGAGKSTLLDLILGLIEPENGQIYIDERKLNSDNVREWQNSIGYVPQSIFLSDDTIASNIAFGIEKELIDYNKVREVLKMAQAYDFVSILENGYDTKIGERGIRLSGGQRQRLGIARALYHDPSLIVLDEATSALDIQTEKEVMNSIESMNGGKTIIMIAHRLSTVENCDQVIKMGNGKILEIVYNKTIKKKIDV